MGVLLLPIWTFVLAFATVPHFVGAISLSDFTPEITSILSAGCESVYTKTISGCLASDFENGGQCSISCLTGLVQINALVQTYCAQDSVPEASVLGIFLEGDGIQVLCNVAVVTTTTGKAGTAAASKATTEPIGSSTEKLSSQQVPTNSIITDSAKPTRPSMPTTQTVSTPLSTKSTQTAAATSTGKATITTTVTNSKSQTTTTSKTTTRSPDGNSDSGGGSPFDNPNNSFGARTVTLKSSSALVCIALSLILLLR